MSYSPVSGRRVEDGPTAIRYIASVSMLLAKVLERMIRSSGGFSPRKSSRVSFSLAGKPAVSRRQHDSGQFLTPL
jgi:hypothetical protein